MSIVIPLALLEGTGPPTRWFCTIPAKCMLLNAMLSKIPIATGGNTAQRNGARVAQADTSSSHA